MFDLVATPSDSSELRLLIDETRLVRQLVDTARRVASEQLIPLSDEQVARRALVLEQAQCALDAARASTHGLLDARGHTDEWDGMRTGEWLARETHTPVGQAKRRVTVSRRLIDEYPALLAAIADGRISWFHADAFCRAATPRIAELMALLVPEFVALARGMRFEPWCKELCRAAARLDVDGAEPSDG